MKKIALMVLLLGSSASYASGFLDASIGSGKIKDSGESGPAFQLSVGAMLNQYIGVEGTYKLLKSSSDYYSRNTGTGIISNCGKLESDTFGFGLAGETPFPRLVQLKMIGRAGFAYTKQSLSSCGDVSDNDPDYGTYLGLGLRYDVSNTAGVILRYDLITSGKKLYGGDATTLGLALKF